MHELFYIITDALEGFASEVAPFLAGTVALILAVAFCGTVA